MKCIENHFIHTSANTAERHSKYMETGNGNIAATIAMYWIVSGAVLMKHDEMKRTAQYESSMNMFRKWLETGLITEDEYAIIDTKMQAKYRPRFGSLFSDPSLL